MKTTITLGTYTRGESQGLYQIELDTEKKELSNLTLIQEIEGPTYLDTSANGEFIYTVAKKGDQGGVASLKQTETGSYDLVDQVLEEGAAPCYVAYDNDRKLIYTANYHKGILQVFSVSEDGQLTLKDTIVHQGSGPHANQDGPHAHYLDLTPDKNYLVSCDLGTDKVHTYTIGEGNQLTEVAKLDVKPGTGPRHLVFHPDGQHAFLFGELSSEVLVLAYNQEDGTFSLQSTVTTLPSDFEGDNSGAAIRISKDGNYLYASNRGHDSIVTYKITENKDLEPLDWVHTEGQTPRDFNLSPDEDFLVVGHQHEDKLTLFERNSETGQLDLLQKDVFAPEVVCVKFA